MKLWTSAAQKIRFGCLERPLSRLCYLYAWFVAAHPLPFILAPILVTCALAYGYVSKVEVNDVFRFYVPISGPSVTERAVIGQLFPPVDGTYVPSRSISESGLIVISVVAQDEGDILRPQYREAVINLNECLTEKISVKIDGSLYTYRNLCLKFLYDCHTNAQIYAMDAMFSNPGPYDDNSYPTVHRGSRTWYIGNSLGGVVLDPLSHQIVEAKAWQLTYQLNSGHPKEAKSRVFMSQVEKEILNYDSDLLDISLYHSETLNEEITRNSTSNHLILRFLLCTVMLWLFASLCSITTLRWNNIFYIDWARSKFYIATCGIISALMGIVSAVGLLTYTTYPYNSVCDAFPFLVLGVRLDNTFLMVSAVHHTSRVLNPQQRLAEAMSEAAVSITITVLTDVLSFGIGLFTDFEAVQIFSMYTLVALSITFVYQLTFLMAILALSLRIERNNRHCLFTRFETIEPQSTDKRSASIIKRMFFLGSHVPPLEEGAGIPKSHGALREHSEHNKVQYHEGTYISRMIRLYYAPFLMRLSVRISIGLLYVAYISAAIYGCFNVKEGLEPMRLLMADSYAVSYYRRMEQFFWKEGTQAQIVFSNPGDLSDPKNRANIFHVIDRFSNSSHGMGPEGVDFWLGSLASFTLDLNGQSLDSMQPEKFFASVHYFLSLDENAQYRNDLRWDGDTPRANISAFRALVGMKNFSSAVNQIDTVNLFRKIASEYPAYNISTFQIMWLFVDQYESVLSNTLQEIYGGSAFMILIAVFFIPSVMSSLWVALAILSIDAGVIGFMSFWDINLDVISMITVIMSIGFSVDFTAHIAYAFVVMDGATKEERTIDALGSLAWPITQGGISTVMAVVVLSGTDSYIITAFFRTVLLVIVIGMAHALLFLPVVLSAFSCKLSTKYCESFCNWFKCRTKHFSRQNDVKKPDCPADSKISNGTVQMDFLDRNHVTENSAVSIMVNSA